MHTSHFMKTKAGRLRNGPYYMSDDLNTLLKLGKLFTIPFKMIFLVAHKIRKEHILH